MSWQMQWQEVRISQMHFPSIRIHWIFRACCLSAINISLPEAPDLSLGNLMSGIKIQASSEDVGKLTTTLLTGYRDYAKEHPEADYSGLGENFIGYLNTERAQEILKNNIKDIIEASGSVEVSKEELQQLIKDIMTGISEVCPGKGLYG